MKGITSETDFENRIREILKDEIIPKNNQLIVLDNKKAVDILICKNGSDSKLFFLEVKYYQKSHGRLGFGHENGAGFQPEILKKRPDFFDKNLKWILGSIDDEYYYLLDNNQISKYISGNEIDYKQNNFQTKLFTEINGFKKSEIVQELINWLQ